MDFQDYQSREGSDAAVDRMAGAPREHLVVIGNGMAGCRAIEELLARDAGRYRITIFGAEPHVNYNRIMLSPVLAGEKTFDEIVINGLDWYRDNGIELVTADPILSINREAATVTSRSGRVTGYDRLLIATGSDPFIIPVPGKDLPGVISFRDMKDVDTMLAAADASGRQATVSPSVRAADGSSGCTASSACRIPVATAGCTGRARWPIPLTRTFSARRSGWSMQADSSGSIRWSRSLQKLTNRVRQPGAGPASSLIRSELGRICRTIG